MSLTPMRISSEANSLDKTSQPAQHVVMEAQGLIKILVHVGVDVRKTQYDKIIASCPFALWTHSKGSDGSPSFGFYRTMRGNWRYKCFSCGESGNLRGFFWRLMKFTRRAYPAAMNAAYGVEDRPEVPLESLSYGVGGRHSATTVKAHRGFDGGVPMAKLAAPELVKLEESEIQAYSVKEVPASILKGRSVSPEAHEHFGLGYDERSRRWVFPVRDLDGGLVGMTGRICWEHPWCFRCGAMIEGHQCSKCRQVYVKYRHSPGPWRRHSVFGIHVAQPGALVVCEGTTDVLRLWDAGVVSPVAILGSCPSPGQVKLIASVASRVVSVGDGDDAGRKMNGEISAALGDLGVPVEVVELPEGADPGSLSPEWIRDNLPLCAFDVDKTYELT